MARLLDEFAGLEVIPSNISIDKLYTSLERYDNVGLTDGIRINSNSVFTGFSRIVGRSEKTSNNLVTYYIRDLDILTITTISDTYITLYFNPVPNVPIPYPEGCTIKIENRNINYEIFVEVLESTDDSVTFANPGNFPSTSNMFIQIVENADSSTIFPVTINYSSLLITRELQNVVSSNTAIPVTPAVGQQEFTTVGTTDFIVPEGVTSISVVAVGGGGGGRGSSSGGTGGNGGNLRYVNNIAVIPGEILTVTVGDRGLGSTTTPTAGGDSSIKRGATNLVSASGGRFGVTAGLSPGSNSGVNVGTGGNGGLGGNPTSSANAGGGGGAGGYSGNGGQGGVDTIAGTAGVGGAGGGGGGAGSNAAAQPGGGVGLRGSGANGAGGTTGVIGNPGSGGSSTVYGGGGGGSDNNTAGASSNGGQGGVRIIWGAGRSYPTTLTADQPTVNYDPGNLFPITINPRLTDAFNYIRFYDNTFVKIENTITGYSTIVQIYNTKQGCLSFDRPIDFPLEETEFIIENVSPSLFAKSVAKTQFLSQKRPYSFTSPMDYLVAAETLPNSLGLRLYATNTQVQGHNDNRQTIGQILPRSNIKGVESKSQTQVITKFKVNADTIGEVIRRESLGDAAWNPLFAGIFSPIGPQRVDDYDPTKFYTYLFVAGLYQLTGFELIIDPAGKTLAAVPFETNQFRLESYDNFGFYGDEESIAISQNNILYNAVQTYIEDLDVFAYTIVPPGALQTLYFRFDSSNPRLIAYPGHYVLLRDKITEYSTVVEILSSTADSITFARPEDFPNNYENQFVVRSATFFYYPKELVFNSLIYTKLPFTNITEPKQNLFVSEYRPIQQERSVNFFLEREFQDTLPNLLDTKNYLNTFNTNAFLPADFRVEITGENSITTYDTVQWYINDEDILTATIVPTINKILYFNRTETLIFKPNDTVRLYNINNGFDVNVEIIESTPTSITIANQALDPIGTSGTYIENLTTVVYPQNKVSVSTKPTSPRENLYYFNLAPGIRYNLSIQQNYQFEKSQDQFTVDILDNSSVLRADFSKITTDNVIIVPDFLQSVFSDQFGNLNRDSLVVRSDRNGFNTAKFDYLSQFNISTTVSPQNPRDLFYYSRIAPGYKYNRSIEQGNLVDETTNSLSTTNFLNKDSLQVRPDRTILSVAKTAAATVIKSDDIVLKSSLIDRLNIDQTQVFFTPEFNSLTKDVVTLKFDSNLKLQGDITAVTILKTDNTNRELGKLRASVVVKPDTVNIPLSFWEKLKVKEQTTQVFFTPEFNSLTKDIVTLKFDSNLKLQGDITAVTILKTDNTNRELGKLNANAVLRSDTVNVPLSFWEILKVKDFSTQVFDINTDLGKLTAASVLKNDLNNFTNEFLKASIVVRENPNLLNYENIEQYYDQLFVTTDLRPNSSRENFYYFNLAPGYRFNRSIQLSDTMEDLISVPFANEIETYEVDYGNEPTFFNIISNDSLTAITGRSSATTDNIILWYINDEDIISIVPLNTPIITLYFNPIPNVSNPYPTGSECLITNVNNQYSKVVQILSSGDNFVSFADPGDMPSTSGLFINRAGIGFDVFVYFPLQERKPYVLGQKVKLENINAESTIITVEEIGFNYLRFTKTDPNFVFKSDNKISNLRLDYFPTDRVRFTTSPESSRDQLFYSLLAPGNRSSTLETVFGKSVEPDFVKIATEFLDRDFFRLREVKVTVDSDFIIRLKTGDFKPGSVGIRDIAEIKKEPIQFWN